MNSRPDDEAPRIVVGVDGFESSQAALRWAIHQAKLTGVVVEAVTAWQIPVGTGLVPAADMPDYQDDARMVLTEAITETCMIDTEVEVRPRVVEGRAAQVLWTRPKGRNCSCWAAGVTADRPRRCSVRSASTACTTRRAPSSSCAASTEFYGVRRPGVHAPGRRTSFHAPAHGVEDEPGLGLAVQHLRNALVPAARMTPCAIGMVHHARWARRGPS